MNPRVQRLFLLRKVHASTGRIGTRSTRAGGRVLKAAGGANGAYGPPAGRQSAGILSLRVHKRARYRPPRSLVACSPMDSDGGCQRFFALSKRVPKDVKRFCGICRQHGVLLETRGHVCAFKDCACQKVSGRRRPLTALFFSASSCALGGRS